MTDPDLASLHARRNAALRASILSNKHATLRTLDPEERARVDAASREFRQCDAEIVAELRRRPGPVRLGEVTLHLTNDLLNYAECSPETGIPIHVDYPSRGMLHDYAAGKPSPRRVVPA